MPESDHWPVGLELSSTPRPQKPRRGSIPFAGMSGGWFAGCSLLFLGLFAVPALFVSAADDDDPVPDENGPKLRRTVADDTDIHYRDTARALPIQDAFGDDSDAPLLIRVDIPDGVFLVYDVAIAETGQGEKSGYAAYWGDNLEAAFYLYNRLLVDSIDVGHALVNLDRDLLIDVSTLAASDPWLEEAFLDALEEAADPTEWIRPGPVGIDHPEGFIPSIGGRDGKAAVGNAAFA